MNLNESPHKVTTDTPPDPTRPPTRPLNRPLNRPPNTPKRNKFYQKITELLFTKKLKTLWASTLYLLQARGVICLLGKLTRRSQVGWTCSLLWNPRWHLLGRHYWRQWKQNWIIAYQETIFCVKNRNWKLRMIFYGLLGVWILSIFQFLKLINFSEGLKNILNVF